MFRSPKSLTRIANLTSDDIFRRLFKRVVFPDPKNPPTTVNGTGILEMALNSGKEISYAGKGIPSTTVPQIFISLS